MIKKSHYFAVLFLAGLLLCSCGLLGKYDGDRDANHDTSVSLSVSDVSKGPFKQVELTDEIVSSGRGYYYGCLSLIEQSVYDELYVIFKDRLSDCEVSSTDQSVINRAADAVLLDHPELFYIDTYTLNIYSVGDEIKQIVPSGKYNCDETEQAYRQGKIDLYVAAATTGISGNASDYDKAKWIYEYIINNTDYVLGSADNQNIVSVMVNGQSVCSGYARSFMYIMQRMGFECMLVNGTGTGGVAHAWNIIKLDGDYYHVDVTWGDGSFTASGEASLPESINSMDYDYLCVPDSWILKNHTIEMNFQVPECTALSDNYYVQENLLMEDFSTSLVQQAFDRAQRENADYVLFKFTDRQDYEDCFRYLIDDSHVWDYVQGKTDLSYYTSDSSLLLVILLKQ